MRFTRHLNTLQSVLTILALLATGAWALYRWQLSGGSDWMVNLDITTEVLPYSKDLRLLVVHVKSKNATTSEVDFNPPRDTFTLSAKEIPPGLAPNSRIDFAHARDLLPTIDLMADAGEGVIYMPGAEFDDSTTLVVKSNSTIFLSAQIGRKEGFRRPADVVSVERVVQVIDQPPGR